MSKTGIYTTVFLLFCSLILNGILFFKVRGLTHAVTWQKKEIISEKGKNNDFKKLLTQKLHEIRSMRNKAIVFPLLRQVNESSSQVEMLALEKMVNKRYLIFYHSEFSCDVCVEESLSLCLKYIDDSYLMGVGYCNTPRYMLQFLRKNSIFFPFYFDKANKFSEINSVWGAPAFILINEESKVEDILFPIKGNNKVTEDFFKSAKEFLEN